jgi:hypothetical protein
VADIGKWSNRTIANPVLSQLLNAICVWQGKVTIVNILET